MEEDLIYVFSSKPAHNSVCFFLVLDTDMLAFFAILFTQLVFLSCAILCTVSLRDGKKITVADWLHNGMGTQGLVYEMGALFVTCVLMRGCMAMKRNDGESRVLPAGALVLYTLVGTFLICHLASLVICYTDNNKEKTCLVTTPSIVQGQNAVYIATALLVPSFIFVHAYFRHGGDPMGIRVIITNTLFILFASCSGICVVDDYVWDWKYAYTTLFALGFTTYISGFSTFVSPTKEEEAVDPLLTTLVFFLQPFLLVETALRLCLSS